MPIALLLRREHPPARVRPGNAQRRWRRLPEGWQGSPGLDAL